MIYCENMITQLSITVDPLLILSVKYFYNCLVLIKKNCSLTVLKPKRLFNFLIIGKYFIYKSYKVVFI